MKLEKILNSIVCEYSWGDKFQVVSILENLCELKFEKCTFKFYLEKEYYGADFKVKMKKIPDKEYDMSEIILVKRINIKDKIHQTLHIKDIESKVRLRIQDLVKIINEDLRFIIDGDTKWCEEIDKYNTNVEIIRKKLRTNDYYKNPIYIKLVNGDSTWKEDLDRLDTNY